MHELSIAAALVDQILNEARAHRCTKIDAVELNTGFLRQIIPEMMQEAFREVTAGTIAQGAKLTLHETPARVRCCQCDHEFEPELDNFICPQCGRADVDILEGNDIILASISAENTEEKES